jgi:hypothetical protein
LRVYFVVPEIDLLNDFVGVEVTDPLFEIEGILVGVFVVELVGDSLVLLDKEAEGVLVIVMVLVCVFEMLELFDSDAVLVGVFEAVVLPLLESEDVVVFVDVLVRVIVLLGD